MASLKKRGLILTFSRAADQAVMMFSPLLLVRILDVESYGQYREFILYAMLIKACISLGAGRSLLYFLPLEPERSRRYVTQAVLFSLLLSAVGCALVWLGGDLLRAWTSFDFVLPLVLYLFFLVNVDYFLFYWLARKRSDVVLFYSTGQLILRLLVVVAVAWWSGEALHIAYGLVAFEASRALLVLAYSAHQGLLSGGWDWATCKRQMAYFLPLGGSTILFTLTENLSRLFVSTQIGATALSLYVIGTYAIPLRTVIRSSVGDVIFPDMVQKSEAREPMERLRLWQQSTVLLCLLLFPAATVMIVEAELIVRTLFTAEYVAAAPIFAIYGVVLLRECFDLTLPVRSAGKTSYFVYANLAGLAINAALLFPFYHLFGLLGPAWAYLLTRLITGVMFFPVIMHLYGIRLSRLLPWSDTGRLALGCLLAAPLLVVLEPTGLNELVAAMIGGLLFALAYLTFIRRFGSQTTVQILARIWPRWRRSPA
ncbi:oligosaccharide flippase family protein [Alkalilimnicola sp. S0819]|uniref:oligosaccharide flippase family protein n=1 Tax=Alkalilimnicola sp. S0819 TaxID=2613922 RepID=UPI0012625938|nr:oligosaccharide flippase family protein [Alkalilimnicola sp. S0819]KAB7627878.1 polysaccharide biosynthesis protein [Alkalilimnicola sp. S0819]MPQ15514.1 oligosaccharide flippase family protein [Alkalilimnicola sp. S0819]